MLAGPAVALFAVESRAFIAALLTPRPAPPTLVSQSVAERTRRWNDPSCEWDIPSCAGVAEPVADASCGDW